MASKTPARPKAKSRRSAARVTGKNSRKTRSAPQREREASPVADVSPAIRREWEKLTKRWQKLLPRLGIGAMTTRRPR